MNICRTSLHQTLRKNLCMKCYKVRLAILFVFALLDGPTKNCTMMSILQKKKKKNIYGWLILNLVDTLRSKSAVIGAQKTHNTTIKSNSLVPLCVARASLVHISLKMVNGDATDVLFPLFMLLMLTMFGSNRMTQPATHLMGQSIYCVKRLMVF